MKAVLFDIYQTLILGSPIATADLGSAMASVAQDFGISTSTSLDRAFERAVEQTHQNSSHSHPEVDVRVLWKEILPELDDPAAFSAAIEDAVHPTAPVPGAAELIQRLHHQGIRLGIVSNAQAYTHDLLKRHLGEASMLFEPVLSVFSYQHLRAKPDPELFRLAIEPLLNQGVHPSEILMIGDSPTNDIDPAEQLGLRAHLIQPGAVSLPADKEGSS